MGPVLGVNVYKYVHKLDGSKLQSVQVLCAYLKKSKNEKSKVPIVTISRSSEQMSPWTYKILKVRAKDVKTTGPKMIDGANCSS